LILVEIRQCIVLAKSSTIRTYTEAHIEVPSGGPTDWQDYYTVRAYPVVDGIILARFAPLEVKVLLESK
jgi:hypothetical protein